MLATFAVQAMIHFYNNEANAEDEEHKAETLQCQETEGLVGNGPGGTGRDWLTHLAQRSGGHDGLSDKSLLPHVAVCVSVCVCVPSASHPNKWGLPPARPASLTLLGTAVSRHCISPGYTGLGG